MPTALGLCRDCGISHSLKTPCSRNQQNSSSDEGSGPTGPRPAPSTSGQPRPPTSVELPLTDLSRDNRPLPTVQSGGRGGGGPSVVVPSKKKDSRSQSGAKTQKAGSGSSQKSGESQKSTASSAPGPTVTGPYMPSIVRKTGSQASSESGSYTEAPLGAAGKAALEEALERGDGIGQRRTPRRADSSASESSTSQAPAEPQKLSKKAKGKMPAAQRDSSASESSASLAQGKSQEPAGQAQKEEFPKELQLIIKHKILEGKPLNKQEVTRWMSVNTYHKLDTQAYRRHRKELEPFASEQDFLEYLINTPAAAEAITSLRWSTEVTTKSALPPDNGSGGRDPIPNHRVNHPIVAEKIRELGHWATDDWQERYNRGDGPAQMALPLILAKNVKVVDIRFPSVRADAGYVIERDREYRVPIDLIASGLIMHQGGASMPQFNRFAHLERLSVCLKFVPIDLIPKLFELPSLKYLRIDDFVAPEPSLRWHPKLKSSLIEHLYLDNVLLSHEALEQILGTLKTLKTLSYRGRQWQHVPNEGHIRIRIDEFFEELAEKHGPTLEDLVMEPEHAVGSHGTIDSLLGFPRLRRVALSYKIIKHVDRYNGMQLPDQLPKTIEAFCIIADRDAPLPDGKMTWLTGQIENIQHFVSPYPGHWEKFKRIILTGLIGDRAKLEAILKGCFNRIQLFEKYSQNTNVLEPTPSQEDISIESHVNNLFRTNRIPGTEPEQPTLYISSSESETEASSTSGVSSV